jgi:hypothetical protein
VNFTVAANPGPSRSGTISVAGKTVNITQDAVCSYTVTPLIQTFTRAGGPSVPVTVTTQASCAWTVTSNAPWITLNAVPSGMGNGTVTFTVAPYTGTAPRTGTLTIAGQTFNVTQTNP